MSARTLFAVLGSLALVLLVGCRSAGPPSPAPPVNAAFGKQVQLCDYRQPRPEELAATGVTCIRARCHDYTEFAQRPRNKDWIEHWFVVTCDVLAVERGVWRADIVSFTTMELRPTPGSGICLGTVWLYQQGTELLFELDTHHQPAMIVGQALLPGPATQGAVMGQGRL